MKAIILLFLLVSNAVLAQQYSMRAYKAVDGLPQSQVNAMVEDRNGYLWIGTFGGGLARFDGREFKTYTTLDGLLSNIVTSLQIDAKQNLWIVHPHGITKFDGCSFKQIKFPTESQRSVWKLFDLRDTIFFQVDRQGRYGKIFNDSILNFNELILPGKRIQFSLRSRNREICYYMSDSSFLVLSVNAPRVRVPFNGLFNTVKSMINYHNLILVDTDKGFFTFDIKQKKISKADLFLKDRIFAYDSVAKTFWLERNGAILKKQNDQEIQQVLTDVDVRQILFDREGNTWMATSGSGLIKYYIRDFDKCGSEKLGSVMAIAKDKSGATWIGSRLLIKIQHGKIKKYKQGNAEMSEVMDIKVSKSGELWVASYSGLGRYDSIQDDFTWYTRQDGLTSQYISSLDFDDNGTLWCGSSDGGLNSFDGKKFKSYSQQDKLGGRGIYSIRYFQKMKTLFACYEAGIKAISKEAIEKYELPELANSPVISTGIYGDSVLLLGSSGSGILIFDPVTKKRKTVSAKDGLPSNLIYFVAPDEKNYVWIGTEQGISRVRFDKNFDIAEIVNYGYDNGLTGVETNQNAFYVSKEKYFGLVDGIYQYNERKESNTFSYPLHLTDVEVAYGEVSSRSYSDSLYSFFKLPYKPVLPSSENHITFYFNRVDKQSPKSVRYKYFLSGFDKTWSLPTDRGMVTYGNLPPGNYTFNIKAINHQGTWDKEPLQYAFVIKAPFYQTAEFTVLVIAFVVGLIIIVSYNKVRARMRKAVEVERIRQQEQENLRKEIARDFHDEMGNQLTRIINYISLMKLSHNGHAVEFYNKVESSAKYLYTGTRDFIWSIDPINDELSKLFFHIRDFGEKLFEEKGIHFRAFNELKEKVKLPYGFSREANLIIKEAMTNAFNHSNAKNVAFSLRKTENGYLMELKDDGKGFSISEVHPNGLGNMNVRAGRIKSIVKIESQPDQGTEVQLLIPEFKNQTV